MFNDCARLTSMDSQRFDLSKRRKRSSLTITTNARLEQRLQFKDEESRRQSPTYPSDLLGRPWEDHTVAVLSGGSSPSEESTTASGSCSSSNLDSSTANSAESNLSISSAFFESKKEVHSTDVFEKDDGDQTTRTIIRPFSRSTTPPNSPAHALFRRLNCMCSTDAFEEELDFIQAEREKELTGVNSGLRLWVEKECRVSREEKWRSAVQAILYERHGVLPTDSVLGRVEVW